LAPGRDGLRLFDEQGDEVVAPGSTGRRLLGEDDCGASRMAPISTEFGRRISSGETSLPSQGYRQDLLVFDPPNGDDGDPVIVEFRSRIREARRRALGGPVDEDEDWQQATYERPAESRAAEIGLVVSLLARADDNTLRKVRKLLEDKVG
jgi:hypothetical protein